MPFASPSGYQHIAKQTSGLAEVGQAELVQGLKPPDDESRKPFDQPMRSRGQARHTVTIQAKW